MKSKRTVNKQGAYLIICTTFRYYLQFSKPNIVVVMLMIFLWFYITSF